MTGALLSASVESPDPGRAPISGAISVDPPHAATISIGGQVITGLSRAEVECLMHLLGGLLSALSEAETLAALGDALPCAPPRARCPVCGRDPGDPCGLTDAVVPMRVSR